MKNRRKISAIVDCVFKAILGAEENKNLLINFLNAVLGLIGKKKITSVTILNPYKEKEFPSDKLYIVDIKAKDVKGKTYQIEVQLNNHTGLSKRVTYTLSGLYTSQLKEGDDYKKLKPVVSIWLFAHNVIRKTKSKSFHHHFYLYDPEKKVIFNDELSLHTLELEKWIEFESEKKEADGAAPCSDLERWTWLFAQGEDLDPDNLPDFMKTPEMEQAMETMQQFSEREESYHLYQRRVNYHRQQRAIQEDMDRLEKEKQGALKEKQEAVKEKQEAVKEKQGALKREKESLKREKTLEEKVKKMEFELNQIHKSKK